MSKLAEKNKEEGKKKGGKLIIILLIVVILALVATLVYVFVFAKKGNNTTTTTQATATQQTGVNTTVASDADEATYTFDEFIVNLADKDSQRYLKVTVALGYNPDNTKLKTELENTKDDVKTPILRDAILQVLRAKQSSDFQDAKKVEAMKTEILSAINPHLKNGPISNVYFSNLFIQ